MLATSGASTLKISAFSGCVRPKYMHYDETMDMIKESIVGFFKKEFTILKSR